jgi:hypothetical protein
LPKVRGLSYKTVEAYRYRWNPFIAYVGEADGATGADVTFDLVDRDHIKGWVSWMSGQRAYSPKTVGRGYGYEVVSGVLRSRGRNPAGRLPNGEVGQGSHAPEEAHRVSRGRRAGRDACRQ